MISPRAIHLPRAALAIGLMVVSGCASGGGSLISRFVKPGEPVMDYGKLPIARTESLQQHIRKVRHVSAVASSRQTSFGATIEGSDPRLAAALLFEAVLPSAESHLQVAEEYRRLGVLDSAHARLNRALRRAPHMAEAHEAMARVWRDWGLPELGLGSAYRATHYDPLSASAQNTLGTLLNALGETEGALKAYGHAVRLDPMAGWALNNLCHLEFTRGRLEVAQTHCEAALAVTPVLSAAHNNLALVYAAAGRIDRAQQEFRAGGDGAAAEYNLGIVHLANGQYSAAARAFEAAIKARPDFTAAKVRARAARMDVITGQESRLGRP